MVDTTGIRLYPLTCGVIDADQSGLTPGQGVGTRIRIPIPAYLIRAGGRAILFDTGMPAFAYTGDRRGLADPDEPDPPTFMSLAGAADTVVAQLALLGMGPKDVDLVINSHLHFDHCGGDAAFTHCPLLLQADALAAGRADPESYSPEWGWAAPGLRYETVDGDHVLAPGVELIATPGHAPGHQSLLLRLSKTGPLLLTIDAVYTESLWRADAIGAAADPARARASMTRLREIAERTGARVIFGHDAGQWAMLRHAPEYYD